MQTNMFFVMQVVFVRSWPGIGDSSKPTWKGPAGRVLNDRDDRRYKLTRDAETMRTWGFHEGHGQFKAHVIHEFLWNKVEYYVLYEIYTYHEIVYLSRLQVLTSRAQLDMTAQHQQFQAEQDVIWARWFGNFFWATSFYRRIREFQMENKCYC